MKQLKVLLGALNKFMNTLNNAKKLLVIVPLYNESIRGTNYIRELSRNIFLDGLEIDYLVIDDASSDDTYSLLNELKESTEQNIIILKNKENIGHGNTVLKGYKYSLDKGYDFIAQVDGDNNVEPDSVNKLINYAIREGLDFVLGKRISRPDPFIRKMITLILDLNLRFRFKVQFRDTNAGIRIFSYEFLDQINLDKLFGLNIPNALLTSFAFYLDIKKSSYPVVMRNNINEQRKGEQWGSGKNFKSKLKLLKGGVACFYEVNKKFSTLLRK